MPPVAALFFCLLMDLLALLHGNIVLVWLPCWVLSDGNREGFTVRFGMAHAENVLGSGRQQVRLILALDWISRRNIGGV